MSRKNDLKICMRITEVLIFHRGFTCTFLVDCLDRGGDVGLEGRGWGGGIGPPCCDSAGASPPILFGRCVAEVGGAPTDSREMVVRVSRVGGAAVVLVPNAPVAAFPLGEDRGGSHAGCPIATSSLSSLSPSFRSSATGWRGKDSPGSCGSFVVVLAAVNELDNAEAGDVAREIETEFRPVRRSARIFVDSSSISKNKSASVFALI